jgi:PAS domain S-box-containing protein
VLDQPQAEAPDVSQVIEAWRDDVHILRGGRLLDFHPDTVIVGFDHEPYRTACWQASVTDRVGGQLGHGELCVTSPFEQVRGRDERHQRRPSEWGSRLVRRQDHFTSHDWALPLAIGFGGRVGFTPESTSETDGRCDLGRKSVICRSAGGEVCWSCAWGKGAFMTDRWSTAAWTTEPAFRSLVEGLPAVVYVADADRADTRYVSPWLEALTGQTPQDWIGDPRGWLRAVHPDDRDGVLSVLASSAERGEPFAAEYRVVTSDGRTRRVRDEAVLDLGDGSWYGWIVDISERAREDARLEFLAFHDPVTGLANGAFFEQHLSLEIGRARRTGETLIVC